MRVLSEPAYPITPPDPQEPPCALSAHPQHGQSGGLPTAQRTTGPTPTCVRPQSRRAESLLSAWPFTSAPNSHAWLCCTSCYLLSPLWVPGTVVRILHGLSHVIPHSHLAVRCHYHPHLTDEETERGPGFNPGHYRLLPPFLKARGG